MSVFEVKRSIVIAAQPSSVRSLVNDFHAWRTWSPWEDVDPKLERTYTGPDAGVGAHYAWTGRKAGTGSMEITASEPERIALTLEFIKPWKATNQVEFAFVEAGEDTEVTWTMTGEHRGLGKVFAAFMSMDRMVGKDFDKGLAALKEQAEAR